MQRLRSVLAPLTYASPLTVAQDKLAEAEPLYKRALAIHEKVLGSEHPGVATLLNNLAELLDSQVMPQLSMLSPEQQCCEVPGRVLFGHFRACATREDLFFSWELQRFQNRQTMWQCNIQANASRRVVFRAMPR